MWAWLFGYPRSRRYKGYTAPGRKTWIPAAPPGPIGGYITRNPGKGYATWTPAAPTGRKAPVRDRWCKHDIGELLHCIKTVKSSYPPLVLDTSTPSGDCAYLHSGMDIKYTRNPAKYEQLTQTAAGRETLRREVLLDINKELIAVSKRCGPR